MKTIYLPFIKTLKNNLKHSPQFIQIIIGARQTGKTTTILHFLKNEYPKNKYIYLSAEKNFTHNFAWILENWQNARSSKSILVIDEIQKIDNWAEHIKTLWDEEKTKSNPISCILLGSSSLNIQKGISESLAGRFQLISAYHWSYSESKESYNIDFEKYLKYGGYPGSYPLIKDENNWLNYMKKSIIEPVIEKDILTYHTVKSPALFKQCFEMLISYPAQEISYTKLLGQIQDKGNIDLIKYYLKLFEGAYLITSIEKYSKKVLKTKSSSPKIMPLCPSFYFLNIQDNYTADQKGRVFELIVGLILLKIEGSLYYWRERNQEVDFVFRKGNKLFAIEVKSNRKNKVSGLHHFIKNFKEAKAIIISFDNFFDFEKDPLNFLLNI